MSRLHALPAKGVSASVSSAAASASISTSLTSEQPHQRSSTQISTLGVYKDRRHLHPYPLPCPQLNLQRIKAKRVTDPLNEAVRARLCGNWTEDAQRMEAPAGSAEPVYSTSGSDHGIDSATLTDMTFLEEEGDFSEDCGSDAESSGVQHSILFLGEQLSHILQRVSSSNVVLLRDVTRALELATEKVGLSTQEERHGKSYLRRFVMNRLRSAGYNAGICKSRWEQTHGYPAGDYEFIDMVAEGCTTSTNDRDRVLVDMDFRAQFEIARPTAQYATLVETLPTLFVGRVDRVRDIIKIMCDAVKLSLRAKGMHLPPWRKYRYVEAKWLGPYKRTTNAAALTTTEKDERQLLVRGSGGIASFKGMGWDVGFTHQIELHFEKAVREANKTAQEKLKRQRRQHASSHLLSCQEKSESGVCGKRESPVPRISGLATALAVAEAEAEAEAEPAAAPNEPDKIH